jgi:hypothetical protein
MIITIKAAYWLNASALIGERTFRQDQIGS